MCEFISLKWTLGMSADALSEPEQWIPAQVPGAVQQDIAAHLQLPPLHEKDTVRRLDVYEDMWAIYRAELPEDIDRAALVLEGKGIDYAYRIRLNDTYLYENEGMFRSFSVPLDKGWKEQNNVLYIEILPPPKKAEKSGRSQAVDSCKPPVCYGWDFHPRLVVRGIWNDLALIRRLDPFFKDIRVTASLNASMSEGRLSVKITAEGPLEAEDRWECEVLDPDGRLYAVLSGQLSQGTVCCEAAVVQPQLWWPNEYGRQALYTVNITLYRGQKKLDCRCVRRGFRRIRLIDVPGFCPEEIQQPQTRELPPLTFEVNNRAIFAKGTNWVCPTMFPGTLKEEVYRAQLTRIRDAHMNIVRCWGGAVVNKSVFFDICDEMGLLVWQEFPLACNNYTDDPHYLKVLDKESEAIICLIRDHACLALWCGGNELFNRWSGMNDQSLALRLLNKNCLLYDPVTPFFPTSPLMGMAHGSYVFCNKHGEDVYQIMNRMHYRAYPEFGCPGAAEISLVRQMIPEEEWEHIGPGGCWELHHAVRAWGDEAWIMLPVIQRYFPEAVTTEQRLECSRFLQGVGYQVLFEEARRQAPYCSMALNWCFNEPWPAAVNNSLISGDGQPKPAYDHVCHALRANMVSVRFERFDHKRDFPLKAEVYVLMDQPFPLYGSIRLTVWQNEEERAIVCLPLKVEAPEVSTWINTCFLKMDKVEVGLFQVKAEVLDQNGHIAKDVGSSCYDLLMR